jgi:hypothetical protein
MDVRIDRLRLRVAGMDADTARQFARLVAERIGTELAALPPASRPTRLTNLQVAVPGQAGDNPASLATAMATGVSRALGREAPR